MSKRLLLLKSVNRQIKCHKYQVPYNVNINTKTFRTCKMDIQTEYFNYQWQVYYYFQIYRSGKFKSKSSELCNRVVLW